MSWARSGFRRPLLSTPPPYTRATEFSAVAHLIRQRAQGQLSLYQKLAWLRWGGGDGRVGDGRGGGGVCATGAGPTSVPSLGWGTLSSSGPSWEAGGRGLG